MDGRGPPRGSNGDAEVNAPLLEPLLALEARDPRAAATLNSSQ